MLEEVEKSYADDILWESGAHTASINEPIQN